MSSVTLRAKCGYNPRFAPAGAKKAYLARITGRDSTRTFAREFLGHETMIDEAGLFEVRNVDKKGRADDEYVVVLPSPGDEDGVQEIGIDRETAMKAARRLDSGEDLAVMFDGEGNLRSAAETKRAVQGATEESAIESCWSVLSLLPQSHQRRVLAELRRRVNPPKTSDAGESPADTDQS